MTCYFSLTALMVPSLHWTSGILTTMCHGNVLFWPWLSHLSLYLILYPYLESFMVLFLYGFFTSLVLSSDIFTNSNNHHSQFTHDVQFPKRLWPLTPFVQLVLFKATRKCWFWSMHDIDIQIMGKFLGYTVRNINRYLS